MMIKTLNCSYFQRAGALAVPIGALAGLVGLGGGEFRLPVLIRVIGFPPRAAVPLNLVISFATLLTALIVRSYVSPAALVTHAQEAMGLAAGGVFAALFATRLVARLSNRHLSNLIAGLLAVLGLLLIAEALVSFEGVSLASAPPLARAMTGAVLGLAVGIVSSMLGVAGGELLIPILVFVFGADIKSAGTASLMISLAIVSTGIWGYYRLGAIPNTGGARRIGAAMIIGSLLGVLIGGWAVVYAPTSFLKIFLGLVLLAAAIKSAAK